MTNLKSDGYTYCNKALDSDMSVGQHSECQGSPCLVH